MVVETFSDQQFEARHVQKLLGIDRNRLFYWSRTHGLFKPEVQEADGTGNRARFSTKNLVELALIKEMLRYSFDLRTVKLIKTELEKPYKELGGLNMIEYALDTIFREQFSISIHSVQQGRFIATVSYVNPLGAGDIDKDGVAHQVPGEDEFCVGQADSIATYSPYIAIRIEIGRLTRDLLSEIKKV